MSSNRVTALSYTRRIGEMGSGSVGLDFPVGENLDPILGEPKFDINRMVRLNIGYVDGSTGPAPNAGFVGLVDSYSQDDRPGRLSAAVQLLSPFKDVADTPPQGLVYAGYTGETLMGTILSFEGHIPPSMFDFSAASGTTFSSVHSNGGSIADVLKQIAEACCCFLVETRDGKLKAKSCPGADALNHELYRDDYQIVHSRSDRRRLNVLKVYGQYYTLDEISGTSTTVLDQVITQRTLTRVEALTGADFTDIRTTGFMRKLRYELAPIDVDAGVTLTIVSTTPDITSSLATKLTSVGPGECTLSVWRIDGSELPSELEIHIRLTAYPSIDLWAQMDEANQSSDQTRVNARIIDRDAVEEYRQVVEQRVDNEFLETEAQCKAVGRHLLRLRRWQYDKFTLRGPANPEVELGDVVQFTYGGADWRAYVDSISVNYNAASSELNAEYECVPMRRGSW
jgi:hypothetical protein